MRVQVLFISVFILVFAFCSKNDNSESTGETAAEKSTETAPVNEFKPLTSAEIAALKEKVKNTPLVDMEENEIAVIETEVGTIKLKFYINDAPDHCAHFKRLANLGFYDNTTFHRTVANFMIQSGDINSKDNIANNEGRGNPGYTINEEFNNKSHLKGVLSMARTSQGPNTAGSQFFICHADYPSLDGQYTAFGEVIEGLEVVDKIATAPLGRPEIPLNPVRLTKVRVIKK